MDETFFGGEENNRHIEDKGSDMVTAAKYIYYEVKNGPRYWIESGPGLVARCYTREDAEIVCKALNILETLKTSMNE